MKYCEFCKDHGLEVGMRINIDTTEIILRACEHLQIRYDLVISKNRHRRIVESRMMIIDLLRHNQDLRLSLQEIGNKFGGKDHTTILHSLKTIRNLCQVDPIFKYNLLQLYLVVYNSTRYFNH